MSNKHLANISLAIWSNLTVGKNGHLLDLHKKLELEFQNLGLLFSNAGHDLKDQGRPPGKELLQKAWDALDRFSYLQKKVADLEYCSSLEKPRSLKDMLEILENYEKQVQNVVKTCGDNEVIFVVIDKKAMYFFNYQKRDIP